MQRRIEADRRTALWIERIVWHAAAGAALAVMILVLLCSLQWLDQIAPRAGAELAAPAPASGPARVARPAVGAAQGETEVAGVNPPSG